MVHSRGAVSLAVALTIMVAPCALAQDQAPNQTAGVTGVVTDPKNAPVSGATVLLLSKNNSVLASAMTDASGKYVLSAAPGEYVIEAEKAGFASSDDTSVLLNARKTNQIDLHLGAEGVALQDPSSTKPGSAARFAQPQFFDEPKFTVAGVTDASQYGGHGSDATRRSSESLAKSAAALSRPAAVEATASHELSARVADHYEAKLSHGKELLRQRKYPEALSCLQEASKVAPANAAATDKATLHELLGIVQEEAGHPLDAVREYQLAAELDPSEPNLFGWGAELLLHGAFEPAIEVFSKGRQQFPASIRMRLGLSVAWYGRGSHDEAAQILCAASDLNPQDPDPYTFMGKMESASTVAPACFSAKLGRFASLQPQNAIAVFAYAVSLWKSRANDEQAVAQAKALLATSIRLDPKLAPAYLQLGIIKEQEKNPQEAIADYKKSIELDPEADEPHYRLAQLYSRVGEKTKAQEEIQLYWKIQAQQEGQAERQRHEMRQFVYTLKDSNAIAKP